MDKKKKSNVGQQIWRLPLLVLIVGTLITGMIGYRMYQNQVRQAHQNASAFVERRLMWYQQMMNKRIDVTDTLDLFVYEFNGDMNILYSTVDRLYRENSSILKSVQLAPDGTVSYLFPGKSDTNLYSNVFKDEDMADAADYAKITHRTTVVGPLEREDRNLFYVLNPVYVNDANGIASQFWGFTIVVTDADVVLSESSIAMLPKMGYNYELYKRNVFSQDAVKIASSEEAVDKDTEDYMVEIPGYSVMLHVSPAKGWANWSSLIGMESLVAVISILTTIMAYLYMRVRERNQQLREMSQLDELTKLYNRHALRSHFHRYINQNVIVLMSDLDNFKFFNDMYGHETGDFLLSTCAAELAKLMNAQNCYRYGGDEFLTVAVDMDEKEFLRRMNEWKTQVARLVADKRDVHLNISGGYVIGVPHSEEELRNMVRGADIKLYEIKNSSKGKFAGMPYDEVLIEEQHELLDQIRNKKSIWSGNIDVITGLPNMTAFQKQFHRTLDSMHQESVIPAVIYISVHNMKLINEQYGFVEGDRVLRTVALTLKKHFRGYLIARLAEDHFILLVDMNLVDEGMRNVVEELDRASDRGVRICAGVYEYSDTDKIEDISIACDRARLACYSMKNNYNVQYRLYDAALDDQYNLTNYILANFNDALKDGVIDAWFQPIVNTTDKKVSKFEALCRWHDPERGFISPGVFIPVLEEYRLIYKLDMHMLRLICQRQKEWQEKGIAVVPISFNISRLDLELSPNLAKEIVEIIDSYGIGRDLIQVEVTESTVASRKAYTKRQLNSLKLAGLEVWLDDFGSGYSSLNTLDEYHFDAAKLDMMFIRHFGKDQRNRVILTYLVTMIKNLHMDVVAEGVETMEQFEFLKSIGCDSIQGYLFSPAVPYTEVPRLIVGNFSGIQ